MLAALLGLWLVGDWEPQPPPPPTPWAKAGARPFADCRDAERLAAARQRGGTSEARGGSSAPLLWARHARRCPHAPGVLVEAAASEIETAAPLLRGVEEWGAGEPAKVDEVAAEHQRRLRRVLTWLDRAIAESERRGQRPPREALYWRAYALTGLNRLPQARAAIERVSEAGDIEQWRAVRLAALIDVMRGELDDAVRLARFALRATEGAGPSNDREISRYIRAFVHARAGAGASARAELVALRRSAGHRDARLAVESVLPVHERIFLRALDHSANGEESSALRLWTAYLQRPEPQPPERVLAQRYLEELTPAGPIVGP